MSDHINGEGGVAITAGSGPMPERRRGLIQKLAEVALAVERIPKRGRNEFHGYDYATEADIAEAVRKELATRHLVMFPDVVGMEWREGREKDGKVAAPVCLLNVKWTIRDGESGEEIKYHVPGAGQDSGDKGPYKALTGSQKYALLKLLQIPTGDDPEREDGTQPQKRGRPTYRQGYDVPKKLQERAEARSAGAGDTPLPRQDTTPSGSSQGVREAEGSGSGPTAPAASLDSERQALLLKVKKVSTALGLTAEDKRATWGAYCERATPENVDPAALQDLLKYLLLRAEQKQLRVDGAA